MPDKKRLDELLSTTVPPVPIRRGQGIRLSTDPVADDTEPPAGTSAPTVRADPLDDGAPRAQDQPEPSASERTNAQTHKRTNAQPAAAASPIVRISQGQRLRADLIKDLKLYALQADRKLYEVMEEAIEQYLERQRRHG